MIYEMSRVNQEGVCRLGDFFNSTLDYRVILIDQEYPAIGGVGIVLVGENNVVEFIALGPIFVPAGGIGFAPGVRVIIDHLAIIHVDIVVDAQQFFWINNGEIIGMLGGVGGRVVFDYSIILRA